MSPSARITTRTRDIEPELTPTYTAFDGGVAGPAQNEAAFRYFLSIERRRAERSARSVLLILVSMRVSPGRNARLEPSVAASLFAALGASVREVDFVGWYHEDRVAAAVLTQPSTQPDDLRPRVNDRVTEALRRQELDPRRPVRVRVLHLRGKVRV